ncbi:MAG: lipoate--protein ligase [Blautia sp.]|nr:lipoate--protein ligase [Blautia sp.]
MISTLSFYWEEKGREIPKGAGGRDILDPYRNLALEKYLTFHAEEGECILYLWQNRRTVVIGKNQNAWKECRVNALEADGGSLVRRLSGGGAVYHDPGNLNFSFCVRKGDYDAARQLEVILLAVRMLGIPAEKSGRNDLVIPDGKNPSTGGEAEHKDRQETAAGEGGGRAAAAAGEGGRKFSGNAFYKSGEFCCHHGTLMLNVDTGELGRYLQVSREKLQGKGISSVQSRVANLQEYVPGLTCEMLAERLREAFSVVYHLPVQPFLPSRFNETEIAEDREFFASWDWRFGRKIPFTERLEKRFSWGGMELLLCVNGGHITDCCCYSDAMDQELAGELCLALKGQRFEKKEVLSAVERAGAGPEALPMKGDLLLWLEEEL